jgi:hypothetical protein
MTISSEEQMEGQSAFKRVKEYKAAAKSRYWIYFGAAFWTFQTCVLPFMGSHRDPFYVRLIWVVLWGAFLCYFVYNQIKQSIRYGNDVDLLAELNRKFGPDVSFETVEEPLAIDISKEQERKNSRGRVRLVVNVFGASIAVFVLFVIVFRILVYHVWPNPQHVFW